MMLLRIFDRTLRDLRGFRFLAILILIPMLLWIATAIVYSVQQWLWENQEEKHLLVWNLEKVCQKQLDDEIKFVQRFYPRVSDKVKKTIFKWMEEVYLHPESPPEWLIDSIFKSHLAALLRIHSIAMLILLPIAVTLIATFSLNRLFLQGEFTLYLVRPLDVLELFWGRFLALFVACSAMVIVANALLLIGGLGPEWRRGLPLVSIALQSELGICFAILSVPFLMAPLAGSLFRGAGTIILSSGILFISSSLPGSAAFSEGLIPFRFKAADSLFFKILTIFQDLFVLPIPRIFNVSHGFQKYLNEFNFSFREKNTVNLFIFNSSGYWWWTFLSGVIVLTIALVVWGRRESR